MPRTVVPSRAPMVVAGGYESLQAGGAGDSLPEKFVKYVPAETIAFLVPLSAQIGAANTGLMITVLVAAAAITVGYLWNAGHKLDPGLRPLPHFYVLSLVALFCWSIGTMPVVAQTFGIGVTEAQVILSVGIFLVPLADSVIEYLSREKLKVAAPAKV